jgi:hypothetical protein
MTCAHLGVDIQRDMAFGRIKNVEISLYFVVGPHNSSTNALL